MTCCLLKSPETSRGWTTACWCCWWRWSGGWRWRIQRVAVSLRHLLRPPTKRPQDLLDHGGLDIELEPVVIVGQPRVLGQLDLLEHLERIGSLGQLCSHCISDILDIVKIVIWFHREIFSYLEILELESDSLHVSCLQWVCVVAVVGEDDGVHIELGVLLQRLDPPGDVEVGVEKENDLFWCRNVSNVANLELQVMMVFCQAWVQTMSRWSSNVNW